MFVALWEFEVKPGREERFEKAYGPDGDWVRLFQSDTHYYQTRLVRDSLRPNVYLTMDFWASQRSYEEFLAGHQKEYETIDAIAGELTVKEQRIGWFKMVQHETEKPGN